MPVLHPDPEASALWSFPEKHHHSFGFPVRKPLEGLPTFPTHPIGPENLADSSSVFLLSRATVPALNQTTSSYNSVIVPVS